MKKQVSYIFIGIGVTLFLLILAPVIQFTWWEVFSYQDNQSLIASAKGSVLGISISPQQKVSSPYKQFSLTIAKLNLHQVSVDVNSNDLDADLAQLPESALPGEKGNVFISGHSSIPILAVLSGRKAWFNNLENLQEGDQVNISALGEEFIYVVKGKKIISPKDLSVIDPPDNEGRYLTLMTCVPPGFNTKRLIVLAKLAQ